MLEKTDTKPEAKANLNSFLEHSFILMTKYNNKENMTEAIKKYQKDHPKILMTATV